MGSDIYSRHEQPIVTRYLHLVTRLLLRSLKEWRTALVDEIPSLEGLGMHGFLGDVRGAVAWLVLRFGSNVLVMRCPHVLTMLCRYSNDFDFSHTSEHEYTRVASSERVSAILHRVLSSPGNNFVVCRDRGLLSVHK